MKRKLKQLWRCEIMDLDDFINIIYNKCVDGADDIMLWVENPKYTMEVKGIKTNKTTDSNGKEWQHIIFQFGDGLDMYNNDINDDLYEYSSLINKLDNAERILFQKKEEYQKKSDDIIEHTDFKELYGKNNVEVRKNHVKGKLAVEFDEIKELEFSVNHMGRRIGYLKELIRTKRVLMEVKRND